MKKIMLIAVVTSLLGCSTQVKKSRICKLNENVLERGLFEKDELFEIQRMAIEVSLNKKVAEKQKEIDKENKEIDELFKEVLASDYFTPEKMREIRQNIKQNESK